MREINQAEIAAVSGAGLGTLFTDVNNALTEISGLFDSTVASLKASTVVEEEVVLSYKAFGLGVAKGFLSAFSNFLTKVMA